MRYQAEPVPIRQTKRPHRMKVAHVIHTDGRGGVEVAARSMAARVDLTCDFKLIFVAGESLLSGQRNVIPARYASYDDPRSYFDALKRLRDFSPDVLICSMWRSFLVGILAKRLAPHVKLVCFVHNTRPAHFVDSLFHALAMRAADAIWFDCAESFARRADKPRKSCRIISFVTERRGPAASLKASPVPRFVSWARLARVKGLDRALRLIAELRALGADAHLEAWGPDRGELASLIDLAAKLEISDRVHFPGIVDRRRLPQIAASASFYLQLSRYEGMAMAVVEAMQLGCVPVVTPVGQIATYCRPGINAVLVDVQDLPGAAREIVGLLERPAAYSILRSNALSEWSSAPLYADDVAAAAAGLVVD